MTQLMNISRDEARKASVDQVAIFVGGRFNGRVTTTHSIINETEGSITLYPDYAEEKGNGECVPMKELWNQPLVDGYIGPMYDGICLRYESREAYNFLSI